MFTRDSWQKAVRFIALAAMTLLGPWLLAQDELQRHLLIYYTSTIAGELEPCGCTTGPLGGFTHRGVMIDALKSEGIPTLGLDGGNLLLHQSLGSTQQGHAHDRRARLLLDLLERNGVSAMAVGLSDVSSVGLKNLKSLQNGRKIRMLSINLQDPAGQSIFPGSTLFQVGGHRVAVVGLTGCEVFRAPTDSFVCQDISTALAPEIESLRASADLLIGLSNLSTVEMDQVSSAFPQFDFILGGEADRQDAVTAGVHDIDGNPPFVTALGTQGRFLGRLDIIFPEQKAGRPLPAPELGDGLRREFLAREALLDLQQQILIEEGMPNPERYAREGSFQQSKVSKARALRYEPRERPGFYYQQLAVFPGQRIDEAAKLLIDDFKAKEEKDLAALAELYKPVLSFVGTKTCGGCHPLQTSSWMGTQHASALDTLKKLGREQDPACISCHTTGFKEQGGYFNPERSAEFANVGCESCHGPLGDHPKTRKFIGEVPKATCIGCHDAANSPGFDYRQTVVGVRCPSGVISEGRMVGETHGIPGH